MSTTGARAAVSERQQQILQRAIEIIADDRDQRIGRLVGATVTAYPANAYNDELAQNPRW
jgi:hypothetical protein